MSTIEDRIARTISEYDIQGWHRTGTDVDLESAHWLAELVRECGAEPSLEMFDLDRVVPEPSYVEVGDRRIEGLPLFDGAFTSADGVQGRLGAGNGNLDILLIDGLDAGSLEILEDARRSDKYRALVFVTTSNGGGPGLAPRNAPSFAEPLGIPILQVDPSERAQLKEEAEAGTMATVVANAEREPAEAANVAAVIPGRDRDLPPLVVMTPRRGAEASSVGWRQFERFAQHNPLETSASSQPAAMSWATWGWRRIWIATLVSPRKHRPGCTSAPRSELPRSPYRVCLPQTMNCKD